MIKNLNLNFPQLFHSGKERKKEKGIEAMSKIQSLTHKQITTTTTTTSNNNVAIALMLEIKDDVARIEEDNRQLSPHLYTFDKSTKLTLARRRMRGRDKVRLCDDFTVRIYMEGGQLKQHILGHSYDVLFDVIGNLTKFEMFQKEVLKKFTSMSSYNPELHAVKRTQVQEIIEEICPGELFSTYNEPYCLLGDPFRGYSSLESIKTIKEGLFHSKSVTNMYMYVQDFFISVLHQVMMSLLIGPLAELLKSTLYRLTDTELRDCVEKIIKNLDGIEDVLQFRIE